MSLSFLVWKMEVVLIPSLLLSQEAKGEKVELGVVFKVCRTLKHGGFEEAHGTLDRTAALTHAVKVVMWEYLPLPTNTHSHIEWAKP